MKKTIYISLLMLAMAAMPAAAQKTLPQGMTQEQYDAISAKLPKGVTVEMVIANLPEGMTLEQALKIMAAQQAEKEKQAQQAAQAGAGAQQAAQTPSDKVPNAGAGTPEIIPYFAVNLGMTSSIGTPSETRSIEASDYNFNFAVGALVSQRFSKKWGIMTGARIERKGSNSNVIMKDYFTKVHFDSGNKDTQGYFSGRSQGWHDVYALTMPLDAMYQPTQKWSLHFGPYFSWQFSRDRHGLTSEGTIRESMLSPLIPVDHSESDNSNKVSKWDCGVSVGCTRQMWRRIYMVFDFSWGLVNQWDGRDYGMKKNIYNVYGQLGFGYKFYTSKQSR